MPRGLKGRRAQSPQQGATDREIHDTVVSAAVFCMCNRCVDGLATWAPRDPDIYRARATEIVEHAVGLLVTRQGKSASFYFATVLYRPPRVNSRGLPILANLLSAGSTK